MQVSQFRRFGIGFVFFGIIGCEGGVQEGTPINVDMSQDLAPKVDMPKVSPDLEKIAMKKAETASAEPSPAPPAK